MIEFLDQEQIKTIFPTLYKDCYGSNAPKNPPPVMLVRKVAGKTIGFSAGYYKNDETFYVSSTGMIPEFRTKKGATACNKRFGEIYKAMGVKYLAGVIENTNKRAIFTALLSGYLIVGTRYSSDGKVYVIITQKL